MSSVIFGKVSKKKINQPPIKPKNADQREREHLTIDEVTKLIKVAKVMGRHGYRDALMIEMMYIHGLRVSELVDLKWTQIDFKNSQIHIKRLKKCKDSTQPMTGKQVQALRQQKSDYPDTNYLFVTERKTPITTSGVRKIVARAGKAIQIGMPIHPHMLRHSTGFYLANKGVNIRIIQDYLGHKNIQHTVRYTELASNQFEGLWD